MCVRVCACMRVCACVCVCHVRILCLPLSSQCFRADLVSSFMSSTFHTTDSKRSLLRKLRHAGTHTSYTGMQPESCANLDLDELARKVEKKSLTKDEAASVTKLLGLRMASVSTFVG